jgi:putative acetyltransferase
MQSGIIFRKVRKEDNATLAEMIRQVFREHQAPESGTVYSDPTTDDLYGLFQHGRSVLWVAELDGTPEGCCGIYPTEGLPGHCVELVKYYLAAKGRGKGTGRKLMELCIRSARELGYDQLYLESMPHFAKAVGIYEKLGFRHLSGPMGNSGHTGCTIWMLLELSNTA